MYNKLLSFLRMNQLRFDQYSSEQEGLKALIQGALEGHEDRLMTLFIQQGPQALRQNLGAKSDYIWTIVFDYLVFNHDVLKRCVQMFLPFFKDFVKKNGPVALRGIFGIESSIYDSVFEKMLDDLVIAEGLLLEHVYANIDQYVTLIRAGKGSEIRSMLGLVDQKYDRLWKDVLDFLLDGLLRENMKSKQKEQTQSFLNLLQSLL